jgi:hypothetical protein
MPVAGTDRTVGQTSHRLISEALGDELRQAVHAAPSIADQPTRSGIASAPCCTCSCAITASIAGAAADPAAAPAR